MEITQIKKKHFAYLINNCNNIFSCGNCSFLEDCKVIMREDFDINLDEYNNQTILNK